MMQRMTTPFITSLAVVAGVALGFGLLYLFVAWRRVQQKGLYLAFAAFALSYGAATLAALASYQASDVTNALIANRWVAFFAAPAYVALLWYVAIYASERPRIVLWSLTTAFAVLGLANLFLPDLLHDPAMQIVPLTLPWGETVSLSDGADAPLVPLLLIAQLRTIGFILYAAIRQYRRGERQAAAALGIGILWFVLTLTVDILVDANVIDFVYLSDLGFFGFAVTMSLQMANSVIETERELARYQTELESLVAARTASLEEANQQLVTQARQAATAEERRRLASELHDSVTQTLYSVTLVAAALPRLIERSSSEAERSALHLRNMTQGALAEMRSLLYELRPETFTNAELLTLLQQSADVFTGRTHVPVELTAQADPRLAHDVKLAYYRIAQEALNNIAKHADAHHVSIELFEQDQALTLRITDDGLGFDGVSQGKAGMGQTIMQERAAGVGASLDTRTDPGRGTTVLLRRPRSAAP